MIGPGFHLMSPLISKVSNLKQQSLQPQKIGVVLSVATRYSVSASNFRFSVKHSFFLGAIA